MSNHPIWYTWKTLHSLLIFNLWSPCSKPPSKYQSFYLSKPAMHWPSQQGLQVAKSLPSGSDLLDMISYPPCINSEYFPWLQGLRGGHHNNALSTYRATIALRLAWLSKYIMLFPFCTHQNTASLFIPWRPFQRFLSGVLLEFLIYLRPLPDLVYLIFPPLVSRCFLHAAWPIYYHFLLCIKESIDFRPVSL